MKQPDNIHLDSIMEEMQIFEEMGGVRDLEDYQNIMQYLIEECGRRLENSKQLEDSEPKHTYIKETSTQNTGGGCMVDLIHLDDGKLIALNDEALVVYESHADYLKEGESCEPASRTKSIWL